MTLGLNTPEWADLFKRPVEVSDEVLENYSLRVMPNFGLDHSVLKRLIVDKKLNFLTQSLNVSNISETLQPNSIPSKEHRP